MEAKHTPGPWARIIDERGSIAVQGNTGPYGYTVAGFGSVDAVNGETQLANAALIAAAPDMYEALEACASMLSEIADTEGTPWFNEDGTLATIKAAQAALAKVERR